MRSQGARGEEIEKKSKTMILQYVPHSNTCVSRSQHAKKLKKIKKNSATQACTQKSCSEHDFWGSRTVVGVPQNGVWAQKAVSERLKIIQIEFFFDFTKIVKIELSPW